MIGWAAGKRATDGAAGLLTPRGGFALHSSSHWTSNNNNNNNDNDNDNNNNNKRAWLHEAAAALSQRLSLRSTVTAVAREAEF